MLGMGKKLKVIFIVLFFAVSLTPLVLMPLFGDQEAESSDADVIMPQPFIGGKINTGFFEGAGDYFSKKFAFRREMVTAGDLIKAKVFGVSGQDGVVLGKDGYLFYKDSFEDFLGRDELSDYDVSSLAYNVKLMQEELNSHNIEFIFTVAPNKNSLYPELMPGKYKPDIKNRNMKRLRPLLRKYGVRYLNLYKLFNDIDDVMYLKGDSHWNNMGAALVTGEIVTALERTRYAYDDGRYEIRKDFSGDLYAMLYPALNAKDEQVHYDKMTPEEYSRRVFVRTIDDMTGEMKETDIEKDPDWTKSPEIETVSLGDAEGSLLMIRDSFGNSLTPWMAEEFSEALFLNGTPYDIGRATQEGYDQVVFETVERNLNRLIQDAPVLTTSDIGLSESTKQNLDLLIAGLGSDSGKSGSTKYNGSITMEPSDSEFDYTYVSGVLDPDKTENDTNVYLVMKNNDTGRASYHALFRTIDHGVRCYLRTEDIEPGDYSLCLAYGKGESYQTSGILGSYTKEDF